MKKIFTIYIALYCSIISAQKIPEFLTKIKFEDAVGNFKIIEVGYDISANGCEAFHPEFGEELDQSPFDSVFDVRAANYYNYYGRALCRFPSNDLLSKRIIGGAERITTHSLDSCKSGDQLLFFIRAIHQPVTISWVKEDFATLNCKNKNWSFFTPDYNNLLFFNQSWLFANPRFGCISKDSYTLEIGKHFRLFTEAPFVLRHEVKGFGMDSIFGVMLVHDHTFFYCDPRYTSVDDQIFTQINLYPNPTDQIMTINILEPKDELQLALFDSNGKKYMVFNVNGSKTINITSLPSGIYSIVCTDLNYNIPVKRFVKI